MAAGNAQIGKLAPDFTATAVMPDGQFKQLKLSDYRGTAQPCFDGALFRIVIICFVMPQCLECVLIYTTKDRN